MNSKHKTNAAFGNFYLWKLKDFNKVGFTSGNGDYPNTRLRSRGLTSSIRKK